MKNVFKYLKGDRSLWVVAVFLGVFSILAVYSSIVTLAVKNKDGDTEYYLLRHCIMIALGFVTMYQAHRLKFTYYSKIGQLAIWLAVALLALTLVKGTNLNNANRWLTIPVINQSFQTSDFAKIALILVVSRILALRQDDVKDYKKVLLPILLYVGMICGLILPANFSTAALLGLVCFIMMFIGRIPFKQLASVMGLGVVGIGLIIGIAYVAPDLLPRAKTWKNRLINYNSDDSDANYQVEHAKYAIASGGFLPNGPGKGNSRNFLPHPYSDMIYAFIIEEYGSIFGGIGLLMLYILLLLRAVQTAMKCPKLFGSFVAVGLGLMLTLQALINMAVAVNLFPVTGQPLPLVSMGGTSTLFTCLAIGIILSVSRSVYDVDQATTPNSEGGASKYEVA